MREEKVYSTEKENGLIFKKNISFSNNERKKIASELGLGGTACNEHHHYGVDGS